MSHFSSLKCWLVFASLVFLLFTSALANAQREDTSSEPDLRSLSLDELLNVKITSSSFFDIEKHKSPGYAEVITQNDLRHSPARNLMDVINMHVAGHVAGMHDFNGVLHGVRGVLIDNNAKTQVMLDGQNLNQRTHFGYMAGMLSPLMGDIDSYEFINGPSALTRGSGALNGFINMVPKNGEDYPGLSANVEMGELEGFYKTELGYGTSYEDGSNLYIYAGIYDAKGFEPKNVYQQSRDYDINAYGFGETNYKLAAYWKSERFNLNAFFYENNPNKGSIRTNRPFLEGHISNTTLGIKPEYTIDLAESSQVIVSASLLLFDFYNRNEIPVDGVTINGRGGNERHSELKAIYKTQQAENHSSAVGVSVGAKTFNEKEQFFGQDLVVGHEILNTTWEEFSLFAEDIWTPSRDLTIYWGGRFDKYHVDELSGWDLQEPVTPESIDLHFSPRLALAYEIDQDTTVKVSYQHGFRMPDAAYYHFNTKFNDTATKLGLPNSPSLAPEMTDAFEINFSKKIDEKLTLETNIYYNVHQDQLGWDLAKNYWTAQEVRDLRRAGSIGTSGMFQNQEEDGTVIGGEVVLNAVLSDNLFLNTSYSYADVSGGIYQKHPAHLLKINLKSNWLDHRLHVHANYVFNNSMEDLPVPDSQSWHAAYKQSRHLVNLAIDYNVNEKINLYMKVHNLFADDFPTFGYNTHQPYTAYVGNDQTRVYLGVKSKF